MTPITKSFQYGQHTVTLETGVIARQATAAVMASMDDTAVLVTVVGKKEAKADQDFFPLTVNYQEKKHMLRVKSLVVSSSAKVVLLKAKPLQRV